MTMPGLSVSDTHRGLREVLHEAPIVLTSGYSEPKVLASLLEQPATHFIAKPFSGNELVALLQALLRRAAHAAV